MLGAELPKLLRKHRTFCPASIRSIPVPNLGDLLDPNPLAPDLNLVQGAQGHGFHGIRLVLLPRIPGPGDANPLSNMMHQGGLRHFFGGMYGNSTHQKGMSQPGLFALNILGKMFQDPLRLTKGCSSSRCTTVGRSEKQPRAQQDATGTPQPASPNGPNPPKGESPRQCHGDRLPLEGATCRDRIHSYRPSRDRLLRGQVNPATRRSCSTRP